MHPVFNRRSAPGLVAGPLTILAVALSLAFPGLAADEDPFAANVRTTEPKTPAEQQKAFKVPPGFEMQWVAGEPDINKPMNMAFDALGRLWVTTSREYPFAKAVGEAGRDRVMIFEDFGQDGRARKVSTFADGLNIPIGVYPFRSPRTGEPAADGSGTTWKAIVWSIPNIWLMEDSDGDGKADRKELLYGPFDHTRDTHGNQASFRRGFDGWVYATHGYNNDSHVAGRDGNRVDMNSGNTYRFRLDGSRIEHHTWGQVNPYGLAWDPRGNLWSSDCHSEPIYLLIPGGYYPSFGKPHDGLGFAPNTMEAMRGSTAIDGISYYADDRWPAEFRDCVYIGDVMTSRVYRDRAEVRGSGRVARAQPDLVVSEDPWFRPVDTTVGPDGCLYVADFYNRIIGHYEVPLLHPGRDRERGRIWRLAYRSGDLAPRDPRIAQDLDGLVGELASPSLSRRMLAMNDLADRFGRHAIPKVSEAFDKALRSVAPGAPVPPDSAVYQQVHLGWLLERFGELNDSRLTSAANSPSPLLRTHALRILARRGDVARDEAARTALKPLLSGLATAHLGDPDAEARRAAATALGTLPDFENVRPLMEALRRAAAADTHLVYTLRQALRNQLTDDAVMERVNASNWPEADILALADVAVAVKSEGAGTFVVRHLERLTGNTDLIQRALSHAARYAPPVGLDGLTAAIRARSGRDIDLQLGLFKSMQQGFEQRGTPLSSTVKDWGAALAQQLLNSVAASTRWGNQSLDTAASSANPWDFEERLCADGTRTRLLSSLPDGERRTGTLRSRPFAAPARLGFVYCGHDGVPSKPAQHLNAVRLRDASTDEILKQAEPPRNDVAQKVEWDLSALGGRQVIFEAADGDSGDAYAWIAFGRFDSPALALPTVAPANVANRQVAAAEVAATSEAVELKPALGELAQDRTADPIARAAAARAVSQDPMARLTADLVGDPSLPFSWRARTADVLFDPQRPGLDTLISSVWKDAPQRFQVRFATIATATPKLAGELVTGINEGRAPIGLLLDRKLRDRLRQVVGETPARDTLDKLVKSLPDEDPAVPKLLEERRGGFRFAEVNANRGREVFVTACAPCHQINGQGSLVGPQLNGIGTRGPERLCEDILAPNRNVDRAFWTTVVTTKDGESQTGLFRREEGELLVMANAAGAEFNVKKSEVTSRKESNLSVMPSNFGEALPAADFYNLLAYLLTQSGKP